MKPEIDTRFGKQKVQSRAGLIKDADILLNDSTVLDMNRFKGVDCVLVDESQFLPAKLIDQFRQVEGEKVKCMNWRALNVSLLFGV
jgi:thymidine kinase